MSQGISNKSCWQVPKVHHSILTWRITRLASKRICDPQIFEFLFLIFSIINFFGIFLCLIFILEVGEGPSIINLKDRKKENEKNKIWEIKIIKIWKEKDWRIGWWLPGVFHLFFLLLAYQSTGRQSTVIPAILRRHKTFQPSKSFPTSSV